MTARSTDRTIAYFSMEICLEQEIPTYSGGLGVLAGDTLRSAADLAVPMVAVTLLHRKGYFTQLLDEAGVQKEAPVSWSPESKLEKLDVQVAVEVEGREVSVTAWRYQVVGEDGHRVPVLLLDTNLPENTEWDRALTDYLYGGDNHYRLCQEVVLGMGGALVLRELGYTRNVHYHLNEGHSAFLTLTLLESQLGARTRWDLTDEDIDAVKSRVIFTTHTPVPAGHDRFALDDAKRVLGAERVALLEAARCIEHGEVNMTYIALKLSRYVNGVAMRHGEVSRAMFRDYPIDAITNGVHALTWTCPAFRDLFDRRIPEWRQDNLYLRYAISIPLDEIRDAHRLAKRALLEELERRSGVRLDESVMTLGFARRATPYKRPDLIFADPSRLKRIAERVGRLQIVYGGKAHPRDEPGKMLIRRIHQAAAELQKDVKVVYLKDYDMRLGALMTAGVDLWLNNPMRPMEASGTSGMKAALNGVPSLSILDGWWIEGHVHGVTGWAISDDRELPVDPSEDIVDLYAKLERLIVPLFYGLPYAYAEVMRGAIALNGSFFNTQRMVTQYMKNAYFPKNGAGETQAEMATRV